MSQEIALPSERHTEIAAAPPPADVHESALLQWVEEARQANVIAGALAQSSFIPASLRGKPQDITAAILTGQEVGMKPMAALRSLDVIQGTPALRAHAMRALLQSKGHEIELVESDATKCIMRGRRFNGIGRDVGAWQTVTWDIERAKGLGLLGKDNWKKQPQAMLMARATGEVCRLIASDALHALAYAAEELHDSQEPTQPTRRVTMAQLTGAPPAAIEATPEPPAASAPADSPAGAPAEAAGSNFVPATAKQRGAIHGLASKLGLDTKDDRADYLALVSDIACRPVTSSTELSKTEAGWVIDMWTRKVAEMPTEPGTIADAGLVTKTREELIEDIKAGAQRRGFESWAQVEQVMVERFAQPFEDIDATQMTEFLGSLAFGTAKPPKA